MSLDPRYCWLDIWAFNGLLERAEVAERQGRGEQALRLTDKAVRLYRGPFLAGDRREPWAASPAERLRTRFLRAVAKLGGYREAAGKWRLAVECYERGLEVDDLASEFYQRLMACYQRLGRRAEGIGVYRRCREILAARLRVPPSPETERLYKSLQAG